MSGRRLRMVAITIFVISCAVLSLAYRSSADKVTQIPVVVPERKTQPNVKTYMKMKELGAHKILDGLIHRDFATIKREAAALKRISLDNPKTNSSGDVETRIYQHFRVDFRRLAGKLEVMADEQNLEGSAYVYQSLTATCISCHDHLRDSSVRRSRK